MKRLFKYIFCIAVGALGMTAYPPFAGQSKLPEPLSVLQPDVLMQQKKKTDSLVNVAKSDIKEYRDILLKPKVKVIYRNRTRTIKPEVITLYIRRPDGTITVQKIKADGGFYIVELDSLMKESTPVEFKEDSSKLSAPKQPFLKRIFSHERKK